jgi:hypothetical protein
MRTLSGLGLLALLLAAANPATALGIDSQLSRAISVAQADVEGAWTLVMNTGGSRVEGRLEIEQEEGSIEGTWRRDTDLEAMPTTVAGEVIADTVSFSFVEEVPAGSSGRIEFVGEIGDQGVMAGTFTTADGTTGEWTARRS